ncbi:DNA repair protein RecN [Candidatus Poribacteria bacterium]|nr:MAG: DNA repair protein RecN [Candidatus Poribacteria bacterium]
MRKSYKKLKIAMIEELYISNVALIDELQLECSSGLNIFTGETGAGKSVILNAVGLALGERSNAGLVRDGTTNAKIQIAVALPPDHPVWAGFNDSEFAETLDAEETLILSRQINANGRSRCHTNGQLVSLTFLSAIGDLLVDIHGQHAHQSLFRSETHLDLLDTFGKHEALKAEVGKKYDELHAAQAQLADFSQTLRAAMQEKDLLEFQLEELEEAQLQEGEEEDLINERHLLSNAETLFESANQLYEELYGGDLSESSTLDGLKISSRTLSKLYELDGSLSELNERFESALYELEDIVYQIRDYRDKIEFNPHRLSEVEERLDLIHRLKRKYGDSISDILAYQGQASQKLEDLQFGSERIEELKDQIRAVTEQAQELAVELSKKRRETATQLESLIERELQTLGMEKAVFQILVSPIESAEGPLEIEGTRYELRADGMDEVEFFISPNVGSEPKPLARIASGGEISRVMLALKTVLAQVDLIPTMIFDEIDAGIGGRTADIVGRKLKELSRFRQVFCITHLPQIARFADQHFRVEKDEDGNRTTITAKLLTPEERVEEVARMHGGEATVTTLAHARELLEGQ